MGIEERGDHQIREFVSVYILGGELEASRRSEDTDRRTGAGAEFQIESVFGVPNAIASDANRGQVRLKVAIKVGNGKTRQAVESWKRAGQYSRVIRAFEECRSEEQERAGTKDGDPTREAIAGDAPGFHREH